ncbi:hypothetical protein DCC85_20080 [Paenibacillus sp. CAA11]|uniref:flagellar protein FlaG n=1 Tax=Paenibacillus sp. CAA11 TaxID=1532905 RepID=UPI000D3851D3|nr:flagellar protein FlaG [Paenibacillus sp. CAA11]AWB46231.1 hypothetical protein DCC85_20080 [Paenibacillus sp. CAA11]
MMKIDSNSSSTSLMPWFKNLTNENFMDNMADSDSLLKEQRKHTIPQLVDKVNKALEKSETHIQVKVHEKTNTIMVVVLKDDTNEVVREIPSEKMLDVMYNLSQKVGIFLDEKM